MADSGITKRALAEALKQLMEELPFSKISVADICEQCDMNRKSFYYHFKDKYDLLNWILDTEFLGTTLKSGEPDKTSIDRLYDLFVYLYENRTLVRKALEIKGQNSPVEHFQELLMPIIRARMTEIFGDNADQEFRIYFFCDALRCTIERWILDPNCKPPDVFLTQLMDTIRSGVEVVYHTFEISDQI